MDRQKLATALDFMFYPTIRRVAYLSFVAPVLVLCAVFNHGTLRAVFFVLCLAWVFAVVMWLGEGSRREFGRYMAQMREESAAADALWREAGSGSLSSIRDVKVAPVNDGGHR